MIELNRKMREAAAQARSIGRMATVRPVWKLMALVWPEFSEIADCVVLRRDAPIAHIDVTQMLAGFGDRTGFEAFYNDTRVEDYVDALEKGPIEGLALGLKVVDMWGCKLQAAYPQDVFHVIVAYDGEHTTVTFHKYRQEEGSWLSIEDLESYADEAIMVKSFQGQ